MKPIGHAGRVRVPVAKTVLDPRHAGGAQISQPRNLHRRRLLREDGKPGNAAMTGQIDEDVDPIAVDRLGEARIGHRSRVAPDIRARAYLPRDLVRLGAGRVAIDLANGPVVPLEQGNREKRDRVEVEIARNVADAKTPPRVPGIAGRLESPRNRPFEPRAEILVPREKSLAGDPLGAGERKQLRGFDVEPVRVELSRRAENLQGFGYAGLAPENVSQERVRGHASGLDPDRLP